MDNLNIMNFSKLSIVITTYNGEKYLREQLDSLYNQTRLADEVIALDDGSVDATVNILEEYHQKHGLQYVVNEINLRVNKNFEKGIGMATGDYISLCDQDDVWFKEKNETLYNKLQELECNYGKDVPCCVSSRNTYTDMNLNIRQDRERDQDTEDYRDTIIHHLSQGSSMMFNRACLRHILPLPEESEGICYDIHIGYVIAMVGHKYDLRKSLMYYRVHGNNLTAKMNDKSGNRSITIRYRYPGIVPEHMIRTFKYAQSYIKDKTTAEKLRYVNKIITLSQDIGIFHRLGLVLTTSRIPFHARIYSLKAALLNRLFS